MDDDRNAAARAVIEHNPEWYHSIELAPGIVTPGRIPLREGQSELKALQLPNLSGKSVLDIGAYDGFFSFAMERLGAARVVALDHYVWSADMTGYIRDWKEARALGRPIAAPHDTVHWRPDTMPGRRPFDAVRALFGSKIEPVVGDFMKMDLDQLGRFDVVLFLGVLYHLEDPLAAMRRVHRVTAEGGVAIIETEAIEIPGTGRRAVFEFLPGRELNNDPSNWWVPNSRGIAGLCRAAGFSNVSLLSPARSGSVMRRARKLVKRALVMSRMTHLQYRYRAIVQARK